MYLYCLSVHIIQQQMMKKIIDNLIYCSAEAGLFLVSYFALLCPVVF